jgi:hypothetical protein
MAIDATNLVLLPGVDLQGLEQRLHGRQAIVGSAHEVLDDAVWMPLQHVIVLGTFTNGQLYIGSNGDSLRADLQLILDVSTSIRQDMEREKQKTAAEGI